MRIKKHTNNGKVIGYSLWLSANDTWAWARKPGAAWPCSELSGNRLVVQVDTNGLCDIAINGKDGDCSGTELDAIVSDHIPKDCAHLWPKWEGLGDEQFKA